MLYPIFLILYGLTLLIFPKKFTKKYKNPARWNYVLRIGGILLILCGISSILLRLNEYIEFFQYPNIN